ncbi:MAG: hypothetical protein ACOYEV_06175 [Candidatus Nanopelagicales bacterium]
MSAALTAGSPAQGVAEPLAAGLATFDSLLHQAAELLDLASAQTLNSSRVEVLAAVRAHAWISVALLRLIDRLLNPPSGPTRGSARVRPPVPPRLATAVDRLAELPAPAGPPAEDEELARMLVRTGTVLGAATDLLATHRDPAGLDRSPESCQLRHPAFLGHAIREWIDLLGRAAALARLLHGRGQKLGLTSADLLPVVGFPDPPRPPAAVGPRPTVTVARPGTRTGSGLAPLNDKVRHLRQLAWASARQGQVAAETVADFAAIGVALDGLVAALAVAMAPRLAGRQSRGLRELAAAARERAFGWEGLGAAVMRLRSLDGDRAGLGLFRRSLIGQLSHLAAGPWDARGVRELAGLAKVYAEAAGWLGQALLSRSGKGLILVGAALVRNGPAGRPLRGGRSAVPVELLAEVDAACRRLAPAAVVLVDCDDPAEPDCASAA